MDNILIEEYRDDILDNLHRGSICIVTADMKVISSVGDINKFVVMRSSAKPIQALPLLEDGIDEKYNFNSDEIAVMASSHRGEEIHIRTLENILLKTNIKEEDLIVPPVYPLNPQETKKHLMQNNPPRKIYHNCAGKHIGFILNCLEKGYDYKSYWQLDNPIQQEVINYISILASLPVENIKTCVDGCGVPAFAIPLINIAYSYFVLANSEVLNNEKLISAVKKLTSAMNASNILVSGTNAICSILLSDSNIIAKGGAQGVYCFGLKKEKIGVAIKTEDGTGEELPLIVSEILKQLNYPNKKLIEKIDSIFTKEIKNDSGLVVGYKKAVFNI